MRASRKTEALEKRNFHKFCETAIFTIERMKFKYNRRVGWKMGGSGGRKGGFRVGTSGFGAFSSG